MNYLTLREHTIAAISIERKHKNQLKAFDSYSNS
jgi:hypothetical protein